MFFKPSGKLDRYEVLENVTGIECYDTTSIIKLIEERFSVGCDYLFKAETYNGQTNCRLVKFES